MANSEKNNNKENEEEKRVSTEKNAGEADTLTNDTAMLKDKLKEAAGLAAENLAGWQRAKADFTNYKRDQEKALDDLRKFANRDMIISLLPTVDSFDLALKHLPDELKNSDWVKGVICIKGMFDNFLRDAGVAEIGTVGEKFDLNTSEIVGEEESDMEEDAVTEEIRKGYMMGGRVIRPAQVRVAKKKEKDA